MDFHLIGASLWKSLHLCPAAPQTAGESHRQGEIDMKKSSSMIAIYSRKSKFTGKGESIGNQIELCREYIRNMFGAEWVEGCEVYEDEGFSGGDLKRPDFQRMMENVRKHRYRAIVVYRLDRISRNIGDFAGLIDELNKLEVSFISIREQFDTGTPMGRAMMYIISVFSQLERETIAERIRDNMHELAKTGRWLGGNTPLGFQSEAVSKITIDGKARKSFKLTPIPEEEKLVKTIFDLYTKTDSLSAVETELLQRHAKTKLGKDFTRFAVKGILQNPVYMAADEEAYRYFTEREAEICFPREAFDGSCGVMAYNRTDQEKGRASRINPVSDWIIALGKHPGLVPSSQWILIQESLERNRSKAYRKPRINEALLTGLLFCSCGDRMYPKLSRRKTADGEPVYTYVCRMKERSQRARCGCRNANGSVLDAAIIDRLKLLPEADSEFLSFLEKSRGFYTGKREEYVAQLEQLRAEWTKNTRIVSGLMDSMGILEHSAAKPQVMKRIEELSEENHRIENRIQELEGLADVDRLSGDGFEILRQMLSMLRASVDGMSVEEKRAAVRTIVRKVIWDGENAHVIVFGAEEGEIVYNQTDDLDFEDGPNSLLWEDSKRDPDVLPGPEEDRGGRLAL